eukprot:4064726-Amphidinium_carterae.1
MDPMLEYFHDIGKWLNTGMEYNRECGRPARELKLPLSWSLDGYYRITESEKSGKIKVTHTVLGKSKGLDGFVANLTGCMHVEFKYSQRQATLVDSDGVHRLPLVSLFPEVGAKNMNTYVQRLYLSPGSTSTLSFDNGD